MATTVRFEDIVSQVAETAALLESNVSDEIGTYAPSIISSKAIDDDEIQLIVPNGHELWDGDLEHEIRSSVSAQRSSTGTPCKLTVHLS